MIYVSARKDFVKLVMQNEISPNQLNPGGAKKLRDIIGLMRVSVLNLMAYDTLMTEGSLEKPVVAFKWIPHVV